MNIFFEKLHLYTKEGEKTTINFSHTLTFIYGNMGVGKTTLLNLIFYCLGGTLIKTPAVEQCLNDTQLEMIINEYRYSFYRKINSNTVIVEDRERKNKIVMPYNQISQFILKKCELPSKTIVFSGSGNSNIEKKVDLSFINFSWFSYLKQLEMDNIFFNLNSDNIYKKTAAINVLSTFFDCEDMQDGERNEKRRRMRIQARQYQESERVFEYLEGIFTDSVKEIYEEEYLNNTINNIYREKSLFNIDEVKQLMNIQSKLVGIKFYKDFSQKREKCRLKLYDLQEQLKNERMLISKLNLSNSSNSRRFCQLFLECLLNVDFPGVTIRDEVRLEESTFMPIIFNSYTGKEVSFFNLGSGGKKTIFKICYALAIHRYHHEKKGENYLPSFFIIDTPMKNISEREDKLRYDSFYQYIFELFSSELIDTQLIIIEKELRDLSEYKLKDAAIIKHMTNNEPMNPPLFKNYRGY